MGKSTSSVNAADDKGKLSPMSHDLEAGVYRSPSPSGSFGVRRTDIDHSKTKDIQLKVDQATRTMEANITAAAARGENLEDLQDKTQNVAENSKEFQKHTAAVKKKLWWKNKKMQLIMAGVITGIVILVLLGVISMFKF